MASSKPNGSEPEVAASAGDSTTSCKNDVNDYLLEGAASFAYQIEHERRINSGLEMGVDVKQFDTEEGEKAERKEKKELTLKGCCMDVLNNWEHGIVAMRKELEEHERRYSELKRVYNECYGELQRLYEDFEGYDVWERCAEDIELIIRQMQDQESIISLLESEMKKVNTEIENTKAKLQHMSRKIREASAVKPPTAALEVAKSDQKQAESEGNVVPANAAGLLPPNIEPGQDSDDNNVEYNAAPISREYNPNFPEAASNERQWEEEGGWI